MIHIDFIPEPIDALHSERFHHPHPRVQLKMEAAEQPGLRVAHPQQRVDDPDQFDSSHAQALEAGYAQEAGPVQIPGIAGKDSGIASYISPVGLGLVVVVLLAGIASWFKQGRTPPGKVPADSSLEKHRRLL